MKIKFTEAPNGREFKVGDVVEFKGSIPEGYARKYINRGWAEEYVDPKPEAKPEPKPALKIEVPVGGSDKGVTFQGRPATSK